MSEAVVVLPPHVRSQQVYPEKVRKAEREADKLLTEWGYIRKSVPLWDGCRRAWPDPQEARAQYYAMLERPLRLQAA